MNRLSENDQRAIAFLQRNCGADLQQLCEALGVTRTAVRQRMIRLQRDGFVSVAEVSEGRGRPKSVFNLTESGRATLGENYRSVAVALWASILSLPDSETKTAVLADFRQRLTDQLGSTIGENRLQELVSNMQTAGFNVESDTSESLPILRKTTAPSRCLPNTTTQSAKWNAKSSPRPLACRWNSKIDAETGIIVANLNYRNRFETSQTPERLSAPQHRFLCRYWPC